MCSVADLALSVSGIELQCCQHCCPSGVPCCTLHGHLLPGQQIAAANHLNARQFGLDWCHLWMLAGLLSHISVVLTN